MNKISTNIVAYGCGECPWMVCRLESSQQDVKIQMTAHYKETGHGLDPRPALVVDPSPEVS